MKKVLNFALGAIIIFLIQYFCSWLLNFLKLNFPSPILGIIILFILLKTKIIKEHHIETFCSFMLKTMILFFIPLFVGIMSYTEIISKNFLAITLTILITTTLVMVLVGLFFETAIKYKRLYEIKRIKKQ